MTDRKVITIFGGSTPVDGDSPFEAAEILGRKFAEAGFAVIGFTDVFNRDLGPRLRDDSAVLSQLVRGMGMALFRNQRLPEYWLQTHAEQIAFLRFAQGLSALNLLPLVTLMEMVLWTWPWRIWGATISRCCWAMEMGHFRVR